MIKTFININDSRWAGVKIDYAKIVRIAVAAVHKEKSNAEISIILTNDSEIRTLNKKYRGIDKATNVLSFETGDPELLGDIYISFDTTLREAQNEIRNTKYETRNTKYEIQPEFINHTTHLVVHGVLHLLGYDHMDDGDAEIMESLEIKILAKLGIDNPYADDVSESTEHRAQSTGYRAHSTVVQLCSVLCGAVAALGFAPFHLWFLTVFGIGVAYYLIAKQSNNREQSTEHRAQSTGNRAQSTEKQGTERNCALFPVLCSFCFGAGYAVASFWWILNSIFVVPELAQQFAIWTVPGIIGIALAGGIVFGAPFLSIGYARRFRQCIVVRPVIFAAAWTFVLWLREWLLTGFPWNPVANISMPFPMLANSMSIWGALGLTFIIIGLTASFAEVFIKEKIKNKKYIPVCIFIALLAIGVIYGGYNIKKSGQSENESPVIRIVQPALSQSDKASHSHEQAVARAEENVISLINLAKSSNLNRNAPANPELIIFPETAYPFLSVTDDLPMAKEIGMPVIIGATTATKFNGAPKFYNSLLMANSAGKIEKIYSKSHLVPFGEYRPFGDIIPTPGQLTPGTGAEVIEHRAQSTEHGFNFVPAICYEIIFSDSLVPNGANPKMIINITNDTWFGKTPGTYQHLDMVRRYAIESGLPIVRANYSGISAFIAADGRVISHLPVGVSGVLDGTVSGAHMTPYRRIGRDGMMFIILLVSAGVIFLSKRLGRDDA